MLQQLFNKVSQRTHVDPPVSCMKSGWFCQAKSLATECSRLASIASGQNIDLFLYPLLKIVPCKLSQLLLVP